MATMSAAVAGALLAVVLPRVVGTSWHTILGRVLAVSAPRLGLLTMVWLAGLFAHTFVMVVALPRLGHRRAMMLNFSGSAVANVVPFGGVLGMGLSYSMLRSWGFSRSEFTLMTILTNVWTIGVKLVLPSVAVGVLVLMGRGSSRGVVVAAMLGLCLAVLVALVARAWRPRRGVAATTDRPMSSRLLDRLVRTTTDGSVSALRETVHRSVRTHWPQLTAGALVYALLQAVLLGLCLLTFGVRLSPVDVFAGFAIGSLLTAIPITPGGLGVSETGMAALLVAVGGDPAATAAAVLLFRTFTFLLEIPTGALCVAAWWMRRPRTPVPSETPVESRRSAFTAAASPVIVLDG
jgi:uncharacterized protein (TIRG00374 family)